MMRNRQYSFIRRNGIAWYVNGYQRRTLTGTGLTKKTAHGCTGKNLRIVVACSATSAIILAGFFCISLINYTLSKNFLRIQSKYIFQIEGRIIF